MDTNALNEIQNTARVLAVFAPESGRKLRRALDNLAECRNDAKHEQHAANCYRANCDEARDELHKLALLVYTHLPDITPEYCRIAPTWRMDDADTPWPAIVAELNRIEDAAIRKLLATPEPIATEPEKPAATTPPSGTDKAAVDTQFDAETRALAVMAHCPEITSIAEVARQAGCTREHLSKNCPRFKTVWDVAAKMRKQPRRIVRGAKDKNGNLEAWHYDDENEREVEK